MADGLNEYVYDSSGLYPELIPFGTVFAGDPDPAKTAKKILEDYNFFGIKMHPFVTGEMMDDSRFFPVYEIMEGTGKILLCHPGSGPIFTQTDGAERTERILKKFPNLKIVIAHCGAKEYGGREEVDMKINYFGHQVIRESKNRINLLTLIFFY